MWRYQKTANIGIYTDDKKEIVMNKYDIAAIIWPAYTGDEPRTRIFWPEGYGEWQTVKAAQPRYPGHQWPRKPVWGYVNEADPYVMEMEINAAADHGVNVFIYDWYWFDNRPFLEQCLDNGFLKARNCDRMKFYLMWANHTADSMWDTRTSHYWDPIWDGAVNRETFNTIVNRTIEKYFSRPNYYKIDGKPVYMLFDIMNLVRGLGGVEETWDALNYFREQTVKAGFPGLELHLTVRRDSHMAQNIDEKSGMTVLEFINKTGFDGVTHYGFLDFVNVKQNYADVLVDVEKGYKKTAEQVNSIYYPNVSMGWDTTPRYPHREDDNICTETTPENIKKGFELAKKYVDETKGLKAPLIIVNSWNEWTEGTYIQPDNINGYGYLKALKEVFLDK